MKVHPSEKFPLFTDKECRDIERTLYNKKRLFREEIANMFTGFGFKVKRLDKGKK